MGKRPPIEALGAVKPFYQGAHYEEIWLGDYEGAPEALMRLASSLEHYDRRRPYEALDHALPSETYCEWASEEADKVEIGHSLVTETV